MLAVSLLSSMVAHAQNVTANEDVLPDEFESLTVIAGEELQDMIQQAGADGFAALEIFALISTFDQVTALTEQGRHHEAIKESKKLVVMVQDRFGSEDIITAIPPMMLAALYQSTGQYALAEPLYQRAI